MRITQTDLPGVLVLDPVVFNDARGTFSETFRADRYAGFGIAESFVQDNLSRSVARVLRGLHVQHPRGQGKLVYAAKGEVFDVAVDVRLGSPTFGRAVWTVLSDENRRQIYIPPGFAHGFAVTSTEATLAYKVTDYYAPNGEQSIRWNDPTLNIPWPIEDPILSERDAAAPLLSDVPADRLPAFTG